MSEMNQNIMYLMTNEFVVTCIGILVITMGITVLNSVMAHTMAGYRRRGNRDAKKGAVRPYDCGWTSPFVQQIVEYYDTKLAHLSHKAEKKNAPLYQRITVKAADFEKLDQHKVTLEQRHNNPAVSYDEMTEEMILRKEKNFYQQCDHISNQQSEHAKEMAKFRTGINGNRQKYLQKKDGIQKMREACINAYWSGVVQRLADAPVAPDYEFNDSHAHKFYMERNDQVLQLVDHYTEKYLQPEDTKRLEV